MTKAAPDPWFSESAPLEADCKVLLEQYKIYAATTISVTGWRAGANSLMLTLNAGMLTLYAALSKPDSIAGRLGDHNWVLAMVGFLLCLAWIALIRNYRGLNAAKFTVLEEIERRLAARLFALESFHLHKATNRRWVQLTMIELAVPIVFALIYLAILGQKLRVGLVG